VRADQLASTFSDTAFHGYRNTSYGHARVGGDDLVDSVWFAAWVVLWALHLVAKPRDGLPVYIVQWRAADYLAAVIGRIAHDDDFH
jgi:hypothetical protein